ncbi:hypothetical protein SCMU_27440 [Sinomonas cyclohexanicum]|uniref:Uncharacterized protein n=1 Tax=Sinomonas cyclohexanicum TaxID=322009 RepID=A0ABM7PX83_SINCY|nr:hypothetical protein SCMU_27440 [Corynebacterium cyclohexanicum]
MTVIESAVIFRTRMPPPSTVGTVTTLTELRPVKDRPSDPMDAGVLVKTAAPLSRGAGTGAPDAGSDVGAGTGTGDSTPGIGTALGTGPTPGSSAPGSVGTVPGATAGRVGSLGPGTGAEGPELAEGHEETSGRHRSVGTLSGAAPPRGQEAPQGPIPSGRRPRRKCGAASLHPLFP